MSAIVFERVPVADLPEKWRVQLASAAGGTVTVRIEQDAPAIDPAAVRQAIDDPAFGIWRDRDDMTDVAAYVRKLREPRYRRNGARSDT